MFAEIPNLSVDTNQALQWVVAAIATWMLKTVIDLVKKIDVLETKIDALPCTTCPKGKKSK